MRTLAVWLSLAPFVVAAGPLALTQCSSSSSPSGGSGSGSSSTGSGAGSSTGSGGGSGGAAGSSTGSGSGNNAGSSTGSGSGSGASSGSSGSTSGAGEGGASDEGGSSGSTSCVSVDGGAQCSNPLMLPCGSSTCNTSSQYCCVDTNIADGGQTQTCVAPNGTCANNATTINCKEAADCASGAVCCGNFPRPGVQGNTSCLTSCTGNQNVQICRMDSECGADSDAAALKKCVLQTCGGVSMQLCAVMGFGLGGPGAPADAAPPTGAYPGCTAQ
jgi:hypothetical protein